MSVAVSYSFDSLSLDKQTKMEGDHVFKQQIMDYSTRFTQIIQK